MPGPESKIETYFKDQCEARGALVRKLKYIGRRGAADRMVVWPAMDYGNHTCADIDFVELKAPGQKPDPHQEREHQRLRDLGANVFVIDSKDAVDAYVKGRS